MSQLDIAGANYAYAWANIQDPSLLDASLSKSIEWQAELFGRIHNFEAKDKACDDLITAGRHLKAGNEGDPDFRQAAQKLLDKTIVSQFAGMGIHATGMTFKGFERKVLWKAAHGHSLTGHEKSVVKSLAHRVEKSATSVKEKIAEKRDLREHQVQHSTDTFEKNMTKIVKDNPDVFANVNKALLPTLDSSRNTQSPVGNTQSPGSSNNVKSPAGGSDNAAHAGTGTGGGAAAASGSGSGAAQASGSAGGASSAGRSAAADLFMDPSMDPSAVADFIAIMAFLAFAAVANSRIESLSHRLLVEADKNKDIADTQAALSTATGTDGSATVSAETFAKLNSHYDEKSKLVGVEHTDSHGVKTYTLTEAQVTAAQHRMDQLATGLSQISQELQIQLQYALASQQTAYESASKIINDIKSVDKSIDSNF
jgi:hypothetical protein